MLLWINHTGRLVVIPSNLILFTLNEGRNLRQGIEMFAKMMIVMLPDHLKGWRGCHVLLGGKSLSYFRKMSPQGEVADTLRPEEALISSSYFLFFNMELSIKVVLAKVVTK